MTGMAAATIHKKALVTLTFDDGLRCQLDRAVPILDRSGLPGTFFVVANTDPIHTDGVQHPDWSKTTWSEKDIQWMKSMIKQGHEIGAHSVSHRRPELDLDPKGEAENSKRWIETRLGEKIPSYCYPFYHVTEPIKNAVMNAGYKQARGGTQNSFYASQDSVDWFAVDCHQIAINEQAENWVRPGCWHVLTYHGIGTIEDGWEPITVGEFERQIAELAKLRDSGSVSVVTFKEGADQMRRLHSEI
jgi:peptidoglycan/xylan/chitin deacetylase (PgdA/CDA1 family)